ncbi:MAG: hypothetical protein JSS07_06440 [Proteobacteria bacterium]|nr:hypothetical protein [Pseudomonadota bacterium]
MKSLADKIQDKTQPVILYELLPPACDVKPTSLEAYIECALDLLADSSLIIDAVNIPDIRDEENDRIGNDKPKMQVNYFAHMLEQGSSQKKIEVILNHCTVYEAWAVQKKWLEVTVKDFKVHSLILVGGSSSKIKYPGPSVIEMSQYIQKTYPKLLCGGITIQSRRHTEIIKDEPYRMLEKSLNGIDYFTSQIVYDANSVKNLLQDYAALCKLKAISPKRVFLSFAPISTKSDLQFLRWLGVDISQAVEDILFKADIGIGWRSAKVATNLLQEILDFVKEQNLDVPLGLNIEHITRHNFELSIKFVERLGSLYYRHLGLVACYRK